MDRRRRSGVGRIASDPFARSIALSIVLIAGGFAAIAVGWRGVARSILVAEQLPYLVSGGIGGIALVLTGAGLLSVQASRYWNAREREGIEVILLRAGKALGAQARANRDGESLMSRVSAPPK